MTLPVDSSYTHYLLDILLNILARLYIHYANVPLLNP